MNTQNEFVRTIGENPNIIEPYGNYVLVEIFTPQSESLGGIALPDVVKGNARPSLARVIAVGQGQRSITTGEFQPCLSKPGDLVVILAHAPVEFDFHGAKFHILFEGDIVGRVNEEELDNLLEERKKKALEEAEAVGVVDVEEYESGKVSKLDSGLLVVSSTGG